MIMLSKTNPTSSVKAATPRVPFIRTQPLSLLPIVVNRYTTATTIARMTLIPKQTFTALPGE
jgi:hypothetical protein